MARIERRVFNGEGGRGGTLSGALEAAAQLVRELERQGVANGRVVSLAADYTDGFPGWWSVVVHIYHVTEDD